MDISVTEDRGCAEQYHFGSLAPDPVLLKAEAELLSQDSEFHDVV